MFVREFLFGLSLRMLCGGGSGDAAFPRREVAAPRLVFGTAHPDFVGRACVVARPCLHGHAPALRWSCARACTANNTMASCVAGEAFPDGGKHSPLICLRIWGIMVCGSGFFVAHGLQYSGKARKRHFPILILQTKSACGETCDEHLGKKQTKWNKISQLANAPVGRIFYICGENQFFKFEKRR